MSLSKKTTRWMDKHNITRQDEKTVVVTGANSGIGFKIAETMVYLGATVIMACRNLSKAESAKRALLDEYPNANIHVIELDIASLNSIDRFVETISNNKINIDVFVNNAGIFHHKGEVTSDGFEAVLGTNFIGTYYICEKLFPYLETLGHPVTLINTISLAHRFGKIDFNDFYYSKHYGNFKVYARSKVALAKYTYSLATSRQNSNVTVLMNHPGISMTPIALQSFGKMIYTIGGALKWMFNSPEKSSLSVSLIMSKHFDAGSIIGPNVLVNGWGYPRKNRIRKRVKTGGEELKEFAEVEISRVRNK